MSADASQQLRLRLHHGCLLARSFLQHGFSSVIDDIVMGRRMEDLIEEMTGQRFYFVMLTPSLGAAIDRERVVALASMSSGIGWMTRCAIIHATLVFGWTRRTKPQRKQWMPS